MGMELLRDPRQRPRVEAAMALACHKDVLGPDAVTPLVNAFYVNIFFVGEGLPEFEETLAKIGEPAVPDALELVKLWELRAEEVAGVVFHVCDWVDPDLLQNEN